MTRLLAAEARAGAKQFFQNIFVTDIGSQEFDSLRLQREFESNVAHHGGDHGVPLPTVFRPRRIFRQHPERGVAVYDLALGIHKQRPIGITIESNAQSGVFALTTSS